jgi:hypothetical protein
LLSTVHYKVERRPSSFLGLDVIISSWTALCDWTSKEGITTPWGALLWRNSRKNQNEELLQLFLERRLGMYFKENIYVLTGLVSATRTSNKAQ